LTDISLAFPTAISYPFVEWLDENIDVFTSHKESLGFVWVENLLLSRYPHDMQCPYPLSPPPLGLGVCPLANSPLRKVVEKWYYWSPVNWRLDFRDMKLNVSP